MALLANNSHCGFKLNRKEWRAKGETPLNRMGWVIVGTTSPNVARSIIANQWAAVEAYNGIADYDDGITMITPIVPLSPSVRPAPAATPPQVCVCVCIAF